VLITVKAKLLGILKENASSNYDVEFIASSGLFKSFKNHYSFHSMKVSGESVMADLKVAKESLENLDKMVVDKIYFPKQIFDIAETSIWKRILVRGMQIETMRSSGPSIISASTHCQVFYRSFKSWMTQLLFQDALLSFYASEMEKYCLENNISFKIILIILPNILISSII
jgi:hypothetical protein